MKMVNLFMSNKSIKHFPQGFFNVSGKPDAKENGWIQFYSEGSPNTGVPHYIFLERRVAARTKALQRV